MAFLSPEDIPEAFEEVCRQLPDDALDLCAYFETNYIGREMAGR